MLPAFKAYDIRGIYPDEVNEDLAAAAARAFARYFELPAVVVGRDMRLSSPFLAQAVIKALLAEGVYVVDLGLVPSPVIDYTMRARSLPAGILISASHNPPQYNGLKLRVLNGDNVVQVSQGHGLEEIALKTEKLLTGRGAANLRTGKYYNLDALPDYLAYMEKAAAGVAGLTLVADYGNGMGAVTARPLFNKLKIKATHLFDEPDGTYPNHPADPMRAENYTALKASVAKERADLGLFFDGDADRVAVVDEKGQIVLADYLLSLFAEVRLNGKSNRGGRVYYDLRASRSVRKTITRCGGLPCQIPVGNPHCKRALARYGGLVAGENSYHIMFPEHGGSDDALYTSVQLLKILTRAGRTLSELIAPYQTHARVPEFILLRGQADLAALYQKIVAHFKEGQPSWLDGLTVEHSDWWFNVRASNTEPVLRVNLEANDHKTVQQIHARLKRLLKT